MSVNLFVSGKDVFLPSLRRRHSLNGSRLCRCPESAGSKDPSEHEDQVVTESASTKVVQLTGTI